MQAVSQPHSIYHSIVKRSEYEANKFVGRASEITNIIDKIEALAQGKQVKERVTVVSGEAGLGKTWLLEEVKQRLEAGKYNSTLLRYRIQLEDEADEPIFAIERLMMAFSRGVLGKEMPTSDLPTMSRQILDATRQLLSNRYLVVFIDQVFEVSWDFLELFEENLLGPLAIEKRVFILLAGRGRKFPWATPELRIYADFIDLQKFDLTTTDQQIEKLSVPQKQIPPAQEIQAFSDGIPLLTYYAITQPSLLTDPQPEDVSAILNDFLGKVSDPTHASMIKGYLLALCVLRVFDDERIARMVGIYRQDHPDELPEGTDGSEVDTLTIRRALVHESLARFDNSEGAYVMDAPVQKMALLFLKASHNHKTTLQKLHQGAITFYQEWCKLYPSTAVKWQEEADHHNNQLDLVLL